MPAGERGGRIAPASRLLLVAALLLILGSAARAGDYPTIHHAGVVRAVDVAAGVIVVDEAARLAPPLLTRIQLAGETVVIRVGREGAEFRGERVPLEDLRVGDYVVARGIDRDGRHHAAVIWSLGPAQ